MRTSVNFLNILSDALTNADPWVQMMAERAIEAIRHGDIPEAMRLLDIQEETI